MEDWNLFSTKINNHALNTELKHGAIHKKKKNYHETSTRFYRGCKTIIKKNFVVNDSNPLRHSVEHGVIGPPKMRS